MNQTVNDFVRLNRPYSAADVGATIKSIAEVESRRTRSVLIQRPSLSFGKHVFLLLATNNRVGGKNTTFRRGKQISKIKLSTILKCKSASLNRGAGSFKSYYRRY